MNSCPHCQNNNIQNLAAMNMRETSYSNTDGSFSGSAIGTGGLMLGGGTYSSFTENQSKRAAKFDEPEQISSSNPVKLLFFGLFGCIALASIGTIFNEGSFLSSLVQVQNNVHSPSSEILNSLKNFSFPITVIFMLAGLFLFFSHFKKAEQENDAIIEYNQTVIPKLQDRYADIFYCEKCNTLFDSNGNKEKGTNEGFQKMMNKG